MPKVKKLADILPPELQEAASMPIDDWYDKPLIFHACREVTGTNGVYVRMVVSTPESDDKFYIATGASQVVEIMRWLREQKQFPVSGKFVKAGRAILLKSD